MRFVGWRSRAGLARPDEDGETDLLGLGGRIKQMQKGKEERVVDEISPALESRMAVETRRTGRVGKRWRLKECSRCGKRRGGKGRREEGGFGSGDGKSAER